MFDVITSSLFINKNNKNRVSSIDIAFLMTNPKIHKRCKNWFPLWL